MASSIKREETTTFNGNLTDLPTVQPIVVEAWTYIVMSSVMAVVGTASAILNGIVIGTIANFQIMKKSMDCILQNLAVLNLLSSVLGGGVSAVSNGVGHFIFGPTGCSICGFLLGFLGIANIMAISLLSLTRYMTVCRPRGINFGVKHARIGLVVAWGWSALSNLPLLLFGSYDLEGIGTSCGPIWDGEDTRTTTYLPIYFTACLGVPLIVILFSYGSILHKVWENSRNSTVSRSRKSRAESQATTIALVTIVAFMISWSPYAGIALHRFFLPHVKINPYFITSAALFAKASPLLDPCVYFFIIKEFREKATRFIRSCFGKDYKTEATDPIRTLSDKVM